MKIYLSILLLAGLFLVQSAFGREKVEPRTVQSVDLKQYIGKWYEIARFPNRFQKKCVGNVAAEYIWQANNRIKVINKCNLSNGKTDTAEGEARIVDKNSNAKLEVRFAPKFLSFLPFVWGDYWILDLGKDYEYALVGSPDRNYLWILSRSPKLSEANYSKLIETAEKEGFDASKLVKTQQN